MAGILRKYIELQDLTNQTGDQNILNNYCPVCSFALLEFKQDDVWVTGLKCANEHIFYSRNGLTYKNSILKPDIGEAAYYLLIDSYLSEEQMEHIPDQIVILFKTIKETSQ